MLASLHNRIGEVSDGSLSLDRETKNFVRENLGFRSVKERSGKAALQFELHIQKGLSVAGQPMLNPLGKGRRIGSGGLGAVSVMNAIPVQW
ncbi:MAG: hypothetical protein JW384_03275 [Nitrosomonadaceae bacterium]|nr:hypothetical protein [Nitrosomonadaceae bacterium]